MPMRWYKASSLPEAGRCNSSSKPTLRTIVVVESAWEFTSSSSFISILDPTSASDSIDSSRAFPSSERSLADSFPSNPLPISIPKYSLSSSLER
ncbi:hypothetical protein NA56DRAFT_190888 [Hyaloscypha hepaticicola]|uniref:Uncharacterized protein n=1 Tax=Hyaloscypha hepaticicola TaxID=2082293 RepID=A0A2J6Q0Y0_9HELO|nr:hypothetical protein NA56DRAFT_190888 [Hyaloscypha hepaticicola]